MSQMKKVQLGVRVTPESEMAVTKDSSEFGPTRDGIVQAILNHHFLFKKEERRRIYSSIPKKIYGRPLKQK